MRGQGITYDKQGGTDDISDGIVVFPTVDIEDITVLTVCNVPMSKDELRAKLDQVCKMDFEEIQKKLKIVKA